MSEADARQSNPELSQGVALAQLPDGGMLTGHVGDENVLLIRHGSECFAVGAACSHYGAPLIDGLLVEDTIRCPWHHACFSLRNGRAMRPPALHDLACWRVEQKDDVIFVRDKLAKPAPATLAAAGLPKSVVIIGGGAAGYAAAQTLRREGYAGPVILISADAEPPYDRPVLSKDYLAGHAQDEWIPLQPPNFYAEHQIDLRLRTLVTGIDVAAKSIELTNGSRLNYGALLLATGAAPVRLDIQGAELPHVHVLRSFADCRRIIAAAENARHCVVIGASFIGLEVAAALRQRKVAVSVVSPDHRPMVRIMGDAIGEMVLALHKDHGVAFHLETTPAAIDAQSVILANGEKLTADLVVTGIGVRPVTALAEAAGLAMDRGVLVDEFLQTSATDIYAAGDIARWPDPLTGQRLRVEHWVVAERQGQVAARNILGQRQRFDAVPFFWSQHYDLSISYVGHAEHWDKIDVEGDIASKDFVATFSQGGKKLAVVSAGRDRESLLAELAFESAISG